MRRMVALAIAVLALGSTRASAVQAGASEMLTVQVNIEFDRSITSNLTRRLAKSEAAAIWRSYGVILQFTDEGAAALCLDVVVERTRLHGDTLPVLAQTTISSQSIVRAPIRISFDTVDEVLAHRTVERSGPPDYLAGPALGRVLAHELGHVLLGVPGYHDRQGLMRAQFSADDLARPERARFHLSDYSVARLRGRIGALTGEGASATCAIR
jgi:hypothetical protein